MRASRPQGAARTPAPRTRRRAWPRRRGTAHGGRTGRVAAPQPVTAEGVGQSPGAARTPGRPGLTAHGRIDPLLSLNRSHGSGVPPRNLRFGVGLDDCWCVLKRPRTQPCCTGCQGGLRATAQLAGQEHWWNECGQQSIVPRRAHRSVTRISPQVGDAHTSSWCRELRRANRRLCRGQSHLSALSLPLVPATSCGHF